MKRTILLAMTLLCMTIATNAQPKVIYNGYRGIEFKLKRCYVYGNNCIIDLTVTNYTRNDFNTYVLQYLGNPAEELRVYDDEGNVYDYHKIFGKYGTKDFGGVVSYVDNIIPKDVTLKIHLEIEGIDEFATEIKAMYIPFGVIESNGNWYPAEVQLKNIPISREN